MFALLFSTPFNDVLKSISMSNCTLFKLSAVLHFVYFILYFLQRADVNLWIERTVIRLVFQLFRVTSAGTGRLYIVIVIRKQWRHLPSGISWLYSLVSVILLEEV